MRVSTAEQNTDLQRRELVEYAERRGWSYEILEDRATGTHANRPSLQRLLQLARSRKIDGVAVWKCDRLFRSLKHAVVTLAEFTELGVEFYSHKDQVDLTSSTGRLLANLLMAFAEFEADLIRSRVVAGLEAAKARGVQLGRPKLVTDELIKQILDLRLRQRMSIRQISLALGRKLSKTSIEKILREHGPQKAPQKTSV